MAGPYLVYAVRDGAYVVLFEGGKGPPQVLVEMPPWGVGLVAVIQAGGDQAKILTSKPALPPTPPPTPAPSDSPGPCLAALLPLAVVGFLTGHLGIRN